MRIIHLLGGAAMAVAVTTSSSAQSRVEVVFGFDGGQEGRRAALGVGTSTTGTVRDTLGVLVMSVTDSGPAGRAGLEEGNRIAAINGMSLRVAPEDAGDRQSGGMKAARLQREISRLVPGKKVSLRVYSNGQFRDVTMEVARAGDLPRGGGGYGLRLEIERPQIVAPRVRMVRVMM